MRKLFVFLSALAFSTTHSQTIVRLDGTSIKAKELDQKLQSLMKAANVQGLGVTVYNNNKSVYQKCFGVKRADRRDLLTPVTNIYGASLSKPVFALLVMKLVEEGIIELDRPLVSYLPKRIYEYPTQTRWQDHYEDLKTDSLYSMITARMCLSHTTSFPNWRWDEPDQKLRTHFKPGTRYSYSGEGMVFLQTVIEKLTGKPLEQLMQEKIFTPLGMTNSSYSWQPRFENDYAWGNAGDDKVYEKDKDNEPRSASTLETTLADLSRFEEAVLQHKVIGAALTDTMFRSQLPIRSLQHFGPLRFKDTTLNDVIELGTALGWLSLKSPYGKGVFKEGHGDGFQHYTILYPEKGIGILIMTNSDNGESISKELLATAIADTYTPWHWENYIPYNHGKN